MTTGLPTLATLPALSEAEAAHTRLLQLRSRVEAHLVDLSQLVWTIHDRAYWRELRDAGDKLYDSEERYFSETLSLRSFRSLARYLAVGKTLAAVPAAEQPALARALTEVGIAKAEILAPILRTADPEERQAWLEQARSTSGESLQAEVSRATGAKPRGLPEQDRVYRFLVQSAPDLETRELAEQFFELGKLIDAGTTTWGILAAGMQEAVSTWEAHRR